MAITFTKPREQIKAYHMDRFCQNIAIKHCAQIPAGLPEQELLVEYRKDFQETEQGVARLKPAECESPNNK